MEVRHERISRSPLSTSSIQATAFFWGTIAMGCMGVTRLLLCSSKVRISAKVCRSGGYLNTLTSGIGLGRHLEMLGEALVSGWIF